MFLKIVLTFCRISFWRQCSVSKCLLISGFPIIWLLYIMPQILQLFIPSTFNMILLTDNLFFLASTICFSISPWVRPKWSFNSKLSPHCCLHVGQTFNGFSLFLRFKSLSKFSLKWLIKWVPFDRSLSFFKDCLQTGHSFKLSINLFVGGLTVASSLISSST